jgi:hypothetical protein
MVATFCPTCDQWVNGNWEDHQNCKPKKKIEDINTNKTNGNYDK